MAVEFNRTLQYKNVNKKGQKFPRSLHGLEALKFQIGSDLVVVAATHHASTLLSLFFLGLV